MPGHGRDHARGSDAHPGFRANGIAGAGRAGGPLGQRLESLPVHELTLQSINGTTSQEDRIHLDAAINHVKAAITKTNSYVSLDGVKNLGGGDLHITIGYADKYNSLDVTVPPVDVQVLGLDKLILQHRNLPVKRSMLFSALNAILFI